MGPPFSISKCLVSVSIFAIVVMLMQLGFIHGVDVLSLNQTNALNSTNALNQTNAYLHHHCIKSEGTYKSGSDYEQSVNMAIQTVSEDKKMLETGFGGVALGETEEVYTRIQCRGDLSLSQCRSCLGTAFSEMRKRCPKNKGRIIWYDYCFLEIRSVYRWSEVNVENNFYMYNAKSVMGNKESFNKKVSALLYKLKEKASEKDQDRQAKSYMFATGEESIGTTKLYAMAECIKDLSRKNCSACLNLILAKLPKCCNGKQGGRVLCVSCNFRYELYPFVKPLVN